MALIVGLHGKALSGKDTAVKEFLCSHEHPRHTQLAFAKGLKHSAAAIFREPLGKFYDHKHETSEQWGITYREMLQKLGTDFARNMINTDFWVKWLAMDFYDIADTIGLVFITDVRFDNEAEWIKRHEGIVVEIQRQGSETLLDDEEQQHASEAGINHVYIDATIINRGTKEQLGVQLGKVLSEQGIIPAQAVDK